MQQFFSFTIISIVNGFVFIICFIVSRLDVHFQLPFLVTRLIAVAVKYTFIMLIVFKFNYCLQNCWCACLRISCFTHQIIQVWCRCIW